MKRIAVVFHNYLRGGAESVVETLSRKLREYGYRIELFTNKVDENAVEHASTAYDAINVYPEPIRGFGSEASAAIAAEIAPMKPDVIWLIGDDYDGLEHMRAILNPGGKLVFALHSVPFFQVKLKTKSSLKRLRERFFHSYSSRYNMRTRLTLAAVDSYVVLCKGYADQLKELYPEFANKIHIIHNPIRTVPSPQIPSKDIAYIGRLTIADKRVDNLLRIFANVHTAFPEWRLCIIGNGPDRKVLERLTDELNLTGAVVFCGYQSIPHLDGAQIICLTSDIEGWGMALIEGMQQGAVPVAFGCSAGVSEILADGRGIEIPPGDLKAYADALNRLIQSPELRKTMIVRAKPFLESLNINNIIGKWQEIL